jgi:hypothetical protein
MNRDQGRRHLAEANRHIAQVKHYIARQRTMIVMLKSRDNPKKDVAKSLLEALKGGLRAFKRHRKLIRKLRFKTDSKNPDQ